MTVAALAIGLGACAALPANVAAELEPSAGAAGGRLGELDERTAPDAIGAFAMQAHGRAARDSTVLYDGLPLRSGDIVVGDRGASVSFLLALLPEEFHPYVHAGVVVIDDGRPYVYEAFGLIRPRLSGPPTDAISGSIRRTKFADFVKTQRVAAVYPPPPDADAEAIARFARDRRADRTPFDPYFDTDDHRAMYCTEFVALALAAGGAPLPEPLPVQRNASLAVALDWLKVRSPTVFIADTLTGGREPVAVLSRLNAAQIEAYFAAKREVYRRFTADQKLGDLLVWHMGAPHLRPNIQRFVSAALARATGADGPFALGGATAGAQVGNR